MRYIYAFLTAGMLAAAWLGGGGITPTPAFAAFHCMRIHAVKSGIDANAAAQYVELRMDFGGQTFIAGHTIEFLDGTGTLKATFTFPASITNASTGDSILIATSEFNSIATGGAADFTFSGANTVGANGGDPLHPIQATNGKVIYAAGSLNCGATAPVDSIAYGTATADYGTAAVAMPGASNTNALRLSNLSMTPTNNSTEYALQNVSNTTFSVAAANVATDFTTPRNNGRVVLALPLPPPSVGGVAAMPDVAPAHHAGAGPWYAVLAGAAGVAATGVAGMWVWRRRSRVRA